jgi:single-strand DNA-binding protein
MARLFVLLLLLISDLTTPFSVSVGCVSKRPSCAGSGELCLAGPLQAKKSTRTNYDSPGYNTHDETELHLDDDEDDGTSEDDDEEEISDEELLANAGGHNGWDEKIARYNSIHLTGRVGNIQEPKYLDDGTKVVINLSLASKRKYHNLERKLGVDEDVTDWYGLEVWGQTAEFVKRFVDKGARVSVVGQLQIDNWTDKESGEIRYKAKVIVRDFDILESKAEADLRRRGSSGNNYNSNSYSKNNNADNRGRSFYTQDDDDDDEMYADESGRGRATGSGGFFDM